MFERKEIEIFHDEKFDFYDKPTKKALAAQKRIQSKDSLGYICCLFHSCLLQKQVHGICADMASLKRERHMVSSMRVTVQENCSNT